MVVYGRGAGACGWHRPVLPAVFDDSLSYYEVVAKLCEEVSKLMETYGDTDSTLKNILEQLEQLKEEFQKFLDHGFDEHYAESVKQWIEENLEYVFEVTVKQVFFGLTSDGHFCAYVPKSWDDISFDTGAVFGTETYGRLILRFAADGQGVIDNDYDYKVLHDTVDSLIELEAGEGLSYRDGKVNVDYGNGLSINRQTGMLEVPIGSNLRYTSDGIDVPDGDSITKGVVKLVHQVSNSTDPHDAVSPQGVFAYAQPKAQTKR